MKKIKIITIAALLIAGMVLCASVAFAQAQAEPKQDFSKLQIVTYRSGLTGFFDPDTGMLYIYDTSLERCTMIKQLTKLGDRTGFSFLFPGFFLHAGPGQFQRLLGP